ncbi:androgen-induced gene 1 protein isoform X2 [Hemicordylus capensis]|uniref:androgen-induced gene 1 protein isoform X2 n=1 Tax=Hemicordylus capensis TaxID=884348 RepID=UPI0023026B3C|nr:androgen-induced gene 1 protein isoform X2 [Hemicordylus capensis]
MALVPCQVLRVAILLSYFSILCNYKAIDMPAHQTYGGSWKFLTFINLFVVTMFWSIYIYDRELVYPKLLDNFIPPWLNHGMHTTVLPFILIEMRTTHHNYPSRTCGLVAVCFFSVGYILWVCWIYHVTGVWVYPLLDYLGSGSKIIFFATVTAIINIFYLLGEILNNCIWDTQKCMEEGKEKPKLD